MTVTSISLSFQLSEEISFVCVHCLALIFDMIIIIVRDEKKDGHPAIDWTEHRRDLT